MEGRCQCGLIRFSTPTRTPLKIYICHCTECRHQSSSAFGISAIFPTFAIPTDHVGLYSRVTSSGHRLDCYFCKTCGSRLVHKTEGKETLSVKGGCLVGLTKEMMTAKGGVMHIWCKSAVVEIPEGVERSEEEPPEKPGSVPGEEVSQTRYLPGGL